jgi:hypothetical protein
MVVVDLALALFSFTVYLLVLRVRPHERGQLLLLGGMAGAVLVTMLIMLR